jgi:hypothetical protein
MGQPSAPGTTDPLALLSFAFFADKRQFATVPWFDARTSASSTGDRDADSAPTTLINISPNMH